MKKTLIILIMFVAGCASNTKNNTYMGYQVFYKNYQIANDEIISLPITKAGPIPAEDKSYKIEVAGIMTGPSKKEIGKSSLVFGFSFSIKKSNQLSRVLVEQVYPAKQSIVLIEDNNPKNENKSWSNRTAPIEINKSNLPWFYEKGTTTFVFKITIESANGEITTLYQPSSFFEQAKEALINQHTEK